jgi:hypothetical protein
LLGALAVEDVGVLFPEAARRGWVGRERRRGRGGSGPKMAGQQG